MTEKLSELVDGEPGDQITARLGQLLADRELQQTWSRYHLIGSVMREEHSPLSGDFTARLEACLHAEPVVLSPQRTSSAVATVVTANAGVAAGVRGWRNLALAASLAAIAILSWHQFGGFVVRQPDTGYLAQTQLQPNGYLGLVGQTQQKMDNLDIYLFEHGQYASVSDLNGLMAYTKFVSYDARN